MTINFPHGHKGNLSLKGWLDFQQIEVKDVSGWAAALDQRSYTIFAEPDGGYTATTKDWRNPSKPAEFIGELHETLEDAKDACNEYDRQI